MQITRQQLEGIDREVRTFAHQARCGLAEVIVSVSENSGTYEPDRGNIMLCLSFPGRKADRSDWSYLGTQLLPDGRDAFEAEQFETIRQATVDLFAEAI